VTPKPELIDVNVYTAHWPFRRVPGDEPETLVAKLREQNVIQAWTGSFDGVFHRDIAAVNERLVKVCRERGEGLLVPFGSVNPALPDWEDDLRRCHEVHGMRGIRLHPNYHGYKLDDPKFATLLAAATDRRLIVQLAISMEDERTQSPLMLVPHVDAAPLAALVKSLPALRIVLLNAFRGLAIPKVADLIAAGQVYADIAMLEGVGGVSRLIEQTTSERILFGSHFPFFYHDSATLKLRESPLALPQLKAVALENAKRLFDRASGK
jgi:uncharacterized protein